MGKIDVDTFIRHYERLYYNPTSCPEEYKRKYSENNEREWSAEEHKSLLRCYLNVDSLNVTNFLAEEKIMKQLKLSTFDKNALAWKAGKVGWENNHFVIAESFENDDYYINGYGGHIDKNDFQEYCRKLEDQKEIINKYVADEDWGKAYKTVMEISPKNIGPVYNINTLFFLTAGKAPIYDRFAHKAVKALLLNISPSEVYLGNNPEKDDINSVVAMYQEYMILLKLLFKDWFKKRKREDMFIPREIDRALWVYGHSKKKPDKFQIGNF